MLQRTLLPSELPAVAGLEVASRYVPAAGTSLGGDWYDVFELPESRIALAVGDVVGHGVTAAAVMAQLRTALRAYAAEGHDAASVVSSVDHLMWQLGPSAMTTLVYVVLDPLEETLEVVNAGHLPPLLIDPDGEARFVSLEGGLPLGISQAGEYHSTVVPVPGRHHDRSSTPTGSSSAAARRSTPGSTNCVRSAPGGDDVERLCTDALDGLLAVGSRRRRGPRRRPHPAIAGRPPHELAGDLRGARRRAPPAAPLAGESTAPRRRRPTTSWSRARRRARTPSSTPTARATRTSTSTAEHREARIRVTVRDHGRWRPPRGSHRGRGLPLMRALMERVDVEHGDDGTVVVLERTLRSRSAA